MYFDAALQRFVMDRTRSGIVDFSKDFALATWETVAVQGRHTVKILYDRNSLEVFLDGGKVAMTNLVFPGDPYDGLELYAAPGRFTVGQLTLTDLGL